VGRCQARDRRNASEEGWRIQLPRYALQARIWQDGGLIIDFVIEVLTDMGWTVARLDCAHDEIHTHFYGFSPNVSASETELQRKVHTTLPEDPITAAYAINSHWSSCYDLMMDVTEGRRP
jgi:hypothetical protein